MKCIHCNHENEENAVFCCSCGQRLAAVDESAAAICPKCQKKTEPGAKFCSCCGCDLGAPARVPATQQSVPSAPVAAAPTGQLKVGSLIWKILLMVSGLIGSITAIATISDDTSGWFSLYNYAAPLCDHEIAVIAMLVVSIILFIVGCCISVYSRANSNT